MTKKIKCPRCNYEIIIENQECQEFNKLERIILNFFIQNKNKSFRLNNIQNYYNKTFNKNIDRDIILNNLNKLIKKNYIIKYTENNINYWKLK